jgi:uncharacterized protein
MKKSLIIGALVVAVIAVLCFVFLPTEGMQLSKANKLCLENNYEEAFKIYKELAEKGNAEATYRLANAYGQGEGVQQSDSLAWKYYKQASELGSEYAKAMVACTYFYGWLNQKKDQKKGYGMLKKLYEKTNCDYVKTRYAGLYCDGDDYIKDDKAKFDSIMLSLTESNDPFTLRTVGLAYKSGENMDGDNAISYFTKAYELGSASSAFQLAEGYLFGWYNKKADKKKAVEWFKKGVERLSTDCMIEYGNLCMDDSKDNKSYYNPSLGIALYQKAAKLNCGQAFDKLGCMYTFGMGVDVNNELATQYFKKAMERKDANGTFNYAIALMNGRGCQKDIVKAKKVMCLAEERGSGRAAMGLFWELLNSGTGKNEELRMHLEKAANADDSEAFLVMAQLFQNGQLGYAQDAQQAFVYMKKAADGGIPAACELLANYYRSGYGCNVDVAKANEYQKKSGK